MKFHEEMEEIFKTRINGNDQIAGYVGAQSRMGRFDDPKRIAMFILLAKRLAQLEDRVEELLSTAKKIEEEETFICNICDFEATTKAGLSAHKRFKHKNK